MKINNWKKNSILVLISVVVTIVGFEICGGFVIRYIENQRPSGVFAEDMLSHKEPVLGFALRKSLDLSFPGWTVRTNAMGFRGEEELVVAKGKNEHRIFIVGGSTVFGWAVDGRETIPFFVQQEVDRYLSQMEGGRNKRVRVINAGVPWYASWHEAAFVYFRILPLQPDAILVLDGLNDTARAVSPTWAPVHLGYVDVPTRVVYEKRYGNRFNAFFAQVLGLSPTLRYLSARLRARELTRSGVVHPEAWTQYSQYMDWTYRLSKSLGIHFAVFFQPVLAVKRKPLPQEIKRNGTAMQSAEFAETFRRQYLEGEHKLLQQKAFPFVSLSGLFQGFPGLAYVDGQHYSPEANRKIAQSIFRTEVRPLLKRLVKN